MKNTNKKGFTLVELLVVIAILAILATVAVVGYTSFTDKAHESNDRSLVAQLNTAVLRVDGEYTSMHEVAEAVKAQGFDVAKMQATAKKHEILWNMDTQKFFYSADDDTTGKNVWVVSDEVSKVYSTYYIGGDINSDTEMDICVATNGTNLTINAPKANVYHYGDVANLTIEAVKKASYHEFGRVTQLATVKKGHVVVENGGTIGTMLVTSTEVTLDGSVGTVLGTEEVITHIESLEGAEVVNTIPVTSDSLESTSDALVFIKETSVFFNNFTDALAACKAGQTIVLVRDVKFTSNSVFTINQGQTVTVDLNGHAIMATAAEGKASAVITNKGNLTIKDSIGGGKITTNALNPDMKPIPGFASNTIRNDGVLVLESGTIENTTNSGASFAVDNYQGATFTMNGGKVVAVKTAIRLFANSRTLEDKVVINGGVVEATTGIWIQIPGGNGKSGYATLIITGGEINGSKQSVYEGSWGDDRTLVSINITGGKLGKLSLVNSDCEGGDVTSEYKEFVVENATITDGVYFNGVKQ